MRLLICAGGTGGGVNPAIAVLQALQKNEVECPLTTLWIGGEGGMEVDLVKRAGVQIKTIPAAGVAGVGARALPGNLLRLGRGFLAARRILREFDPDVMLFTGGYLAVPVALAGRFSPRKSRPRSLLYIPDIEPGLALKTLARFCDHIAITAEDTRSFLPARQPATLTGYPVRSGLQPWPMEKARQVFGLAPHLPALLVTGGSRGCRPINRAALSLLPELLVEMQIIHITGQLDWQEVGQSWKEMNDTGKVPQELASRYHLFPYLHDEMAAAMTAADLALSRAGASTLGEYPLFGLPAILVPYPYAWRYQNVNAQYLVQQGAAVMLDETRGNLAEQARPAILDLVRNAARRGEMSAAMRSLVKADPAQAIGKLLVSLAGTTAGKGN